MKSIDTRNVVGVLAMLSAGLALTGCAHMMSGAKQDVSSDTQGVRTAAAQATTTVKHVGTEVAAVPGKVGTAVTTTAKNVGNAVEAVPKNVGAEAVIVPEVKTSIIRDPVLNDPKNVISVSAHDGLVHLTGHVQNASMQQRATEDTQVVLTKSHPDYKVSNELTIQ